MVASELPTTASQLTGAPQAPAAAAPLNSGDAAAAESSADFVSVLTQLLGTAAPVSDAAGVVKTGLAKQADDTSDSDLDAAALANAAAQVAPTVLPVVAEIAQALGNTARAEFAPTQTGEQELGASAASAIVANAQLQAAAPIEGRTVAGAAFKAAAADAQAQLLQAQQLQTDADANAATSSDTSGGSDAKAGKQDSTQGNWNAALSLNAGATQNGVPRAELHVQSHVGSAAWRDEVGAKLTWMIDRGIQQGTLRLSPDNLGPMEVRITTQNDQVSVWFGAAHADTRAALENALPRLREMFAAQGLSLSDAGVFREPPKDTSRAYVANRGEVAGIEVEHGTVSIGRRNGLLDAYA